MVTTILSVVHDDYKSLFSPWGLQVLVQFMVTTSPGAVHDDYKS